MRAYRPYPVRWKYLLLLVQIIVISSTASEAQTYSDIASQQGLDFLIPIHEMPPDSKVGAGASFGSGVSFFDFDGDGWDDLTFANVDDSLIFFRNNEGSFERSPSILLVEGKAKQVLWVDVDNDGDHDLFISTYLGPLYLLRNDGNWTFTDISLSSGLSVEDGRFYGASFGDYDKDGFLDLYVCSYIIEDLAAVPLYRNHLYRNNGDGTFADVTFDAGVGNGLAPSYQSIWLDVNEDGWPDLYVINDLEPPNALFQNNGDGTFSEVTGSAGLSLPDEHAMSISVADIDNDGDLDIFISNTGLFPELNSARSLLMVNNGDGTYTENSEFLDLNIFEWGWGGLWVDHDNNGYKDLYLATHRGSGSVVPNQFHINNAGTSFSDGSSLFPHLQYAASHSVARGDLDRNGYSDIVVQNQDPFPPYLWQNSGGENAYIRITLEGTVSNKQAVGSWIRVFAGGQQYVSYTLCGQNYLGQNSQHILFGLGDATVVDSVHVTYLSGQVDRYYGLPVNTEHHFIEGGYTPVITALGPVVVCGPDTVVLDAGEHASYTWNNGHTGRTLSTDTTGSFWVTVGSNEGLLGTTDTVHVRIDPPVVVEAQRTDPACAGGSTGAIELVELSGGSTSEVVWSSGASGAALEGLPAGVYGYIYTDLNGCSTSGTVELMDPPELYALVLVAPVEEGEDGSIAWTVFGGTPPYTVAVNGVVVPGTAMDIPVPGTYSIVVTDATGCVYVEDVIVEGLTTVLDHNVQQARIHPNPVSAALYVEWHRPIARWRVSDATGRIMFGGTDELISGVLDVSSLRAGTYVLELRGARGSVVRNRFVKQ